MLPGRWSIATRTRNVQLSRVRAVEVKVLAVVARWTFGAKPWHEHRTLVMTEIKAELLTTWVALVPRCGFVEVAASRTKDEPEAVQLGFRV